MSSSQLKSDTARANGAKSHGPVTPEGRAASSQNSLRHGLSAKSVCLPDESQEEFQLLLDSYTEQYHPQGEAQMQLVEAMATARWRLRRLAPMETSLLSTEILRCSEDIEEQFENMTGHDQMAWVFQKLADDGHSLALLLRYEGTLNRAHDRAFKQLELLRHRPVQNEPKPDP